MDRQYDLFTLKNLDHLAARIKIQQFPSRHLGIPERDSTVDITIAHPECLDGSPVNTTNFQTVITLWNILDLN